MYFSSAVKSTNYARSQEFSLGSRTIASYCMYHRFPITSHDAFNNACDQVMSFTPTSCGLKYNTKFTVQGWWFGGKRSRYRTQYPSPPVGDTLDRLFENHRLTLFVEYFEQYLRDREFITVDDPPRFHGPMAIYQDGETCYLAACLNFCLHVPELRNDFFKAFRIKSVGLEKLTNPGFSMLGGGKHTEVPGLVKEDFVDQPLGAQLLSLAKDIEEWSRTRDDPILHYGMSRSLMMAFMLRISGFDELEEKILKLRTEPPLDKTNLYTTTRYMIRDALDRNSSLRGGIISASDGMGRRHAIACVRDPFTNHIRIYNWGVSDTWHQLRTFLNIFPEEIEIILYSLNSVSRSIDFGTKPVKRKPSLTVRSLKLAMEYVRKTWREQPTLHGYIN